MRTGSRAILLRHPLMQPPWMAHMQGVVVGRRGRAILVQLEGLARPTECHPDIVCPVYGDCEACSYVAYASVDMGSREEPEMHHFCSWHIGEVRECVVEDEDR